MVSQGFTPPSHHTATDHLCQAAGRPSFTQPSVGGSSFPPRDEIFAIIKHDTFGFVEIEALGRDSTIWKSTRRVVADIESKSLLDAEDNY
jgi:hypothetical protein